MKRFINEWILKVVPFFAPLPTAYVIFGSLQSVLGWDTWVALVAAGVIEMIGFRSVGLAVEMYQFNRTCSAVEKSLRAPQWQSLTTVAIYVLAVLGLTILLEIMPSIALWSPLAFVGFGLTGAWLAALTSDQDEREQTRNEQRRKAKEALELARKDKQKSKQDQQLAQVAPAIPDKLHPQVAQARPALARKDDKQVSKQPVQDAALLAYWQGKPKASDQQVAEHFGKSRQAIQQRRLKLIERGDIKMTPQGVAFAAISVSMPEKAEK